MGTFSAGRSLPVKRFSSVYTFPRDLTFLKSNRLRSKRFQSSYCAKVGGGAKKNGMGREVIPTLTTFSANSARRLDPQDRIPITSYWTSQIGLFWCWIRQKLKFTMLSPPFRHFFLSSIYGWPLETTMIMVKRLLPVIEVIFDCPLFLIKKTLVI